MGKYRGILIFEKGDYKFYIDPIDHSLSGTYANVNISLDDYLDDYEDLLLTIPEIDLDDGYIRALLTDYCKELATVLDQEFERDHARQIEELGYDPNRDQMQDYWDHESDKIAIQQEFHDNETS